MHFPTLWEFFFYRELVLIHVQTFVKERAYNSVHCIRNIKIVPYKIFSAFNRRWNTDVGRRHPNLWHFINKLRAEEVKCTLAVAASDRGEEPPRRKRKYRDLERRIRRLKRSYRAGNRTLTQYWNAMTYVVATFH